MEQLSVEDDKKPADEFTYCSLNQTKEYHPALIPSFSYFAVGTTRGFDIFGVDPIELRYSYGFSPFISPLLEGEPVAIVEMLYVASTVAVVGMKERGIFSPRRVTFWDTNTNSVTAGLSLMSRVLGLRMSQNRFFTA